MQKIGLRLALATALVTSCASMGLTPANAATITWNFNSGTGAAPNSNAQTYTATDLTTTLTAQGFSNNLFTTPVTLYNKNDGGNEIGLGLADDPQHEIKGAEVISIVLGIAHTSMTFSMNSVDNNEGWQVWGSATGGAGTYSLLLSNNGLLDEGTHTLTGTGGTDLFYYIAYVDDGSPSGGQGSNILLHTLSIEPTTGRNGDPTPLPAALPLFGTGLGALGLLGWRRKRKARATV
jgi:hypothetical protein